MGGWMWGGTDELESPHTIHAAIDPGITLIDTAPVYCFGHSEGRRHRRVPISTEVGLNWKNGRPFRNAGKECIYKEIYHSLQRLRADVIDLYQVHWHDPNVPIEESAAAMVVNWVLSPAVPNFRYETK